MGLYRRARSPYWWMFVSRRGESDIYESTRIPIDAPTAEQRNRNHKLALLAYHARLGDVARDYYDLPAVTSSDEEDDADTFATWAEWYDTNAVAHHRGAEREREILETLVATFGDVKLHKVTRTAVVEWMTARVTPTRRARTVNREVALLKTMLNVAVEHGKLESSPIAGMKLLRTTTPVRRTLSREEEVRLLAALRTPADKALLIMGLDTLCRLGDCLDLRRSDDRKTRLYIRDPKAGEGYYVPVSKRLREALDAVPKSKGAIYYFAHRRRLKTENARRGGVRQMLEHACASAVPPVPFGKAQGGITWHWATRRTGATRMLEKGADLPTVQRAGHWQDPTMVLGIYAESDDPRVRAAVEMVGPDTDLTPIKKQEKRGAKRR